MKRAEEVTTIEDFKKIAALMGNSYPTNKVKLMQGKKKVTPNNDDEEEEQKPLTTAIIPYTQADQMGAEVIQHQCRTSGALRHWRCTKIPKCRISVILIDQSAVCPRFWLITSGRASYHTVYGSDNCKQTT